MKRVLPVVIATLILGSGCRREAEPAVVADATPATAQQPAVEAPAPAAAAAPAATAATDAVTVVDHGSPVGDNKTFDARSFAIAGPPCLISRP